MRTLARQAEIGVCLGPSTEDRFCGGSSRKKFLDCTLWVKKTRQPTHVDNFAKNWSIFKILSLIDSEQNFLQNNYCIAHHTLQMLLHYLVKLQCFKNRINSKIHYRRTLFWSIFCRCTCLISFSRKIRVSIKNYEISVRIKYSVRDLIYDIHICAWAAMTQ